MNYSLVAGFLVSLSFILLFIDTLSGKDECKFGGAFVGLYLMGVIFWLCLGVLMNQVALVIISILQMLFIGLYWSQRFRKNG